MPKIRTAFKILQEPGKLVRILGDKKFFNWMPDKQYLKLLYKTETGRRLNFKNPRTYNEKLQWIKLYDKKPEYTLYADKYRVREYISKTIGGEHLIPLLDVYNSVSEIEWDGFPDQFVLKCTHGSGSNIICKDKSKLDIVEAERKLEKWMKKNWYWFGREWCYKNIKPRIICEKYMVDESGYELKDYKFFCFNGEPKLVQVDYDRFAGHERNVYSLEWEFIDVIIKYPNNPKRQIEKPKNLDGMIKIAAILSKGIPHVRVDLYDVNGSIYFGEMTFYHGSGFEKIIPESYDYLLGNWIKLPLPNSSNVKNEN